MDASFSATPNVFTLPNSVDFGYKNDLQTLDYNNLTGFDSKTYALTGDLFSNSNSLFSCHMNDYAMDMNNTFNADQSSVQPAPEPMGVDMNSTLNDASGLGAYYPNGYYAPTQYFGAQFSPEAGVNAQANAGLSGGEYNMEKLNTDFTGLSETSLVDPSITIGDSASDKSLKSPNYSYQAPYVPAESLSGSGNPGAMNYDAFSYYPYAPVAQDGMQATMCAYPGGFQPALDEKPEWAGFHKGDAGSDKNSYNEELESVADASTCESTPVMQPSQPQLLGFGASPESTPLGAAFQPALGAFELGQAQLNGTYYYPGFYPGQYGQGLYYGQYAPEAYAPDGLLAEGYGMGDDGSESILEIANEIANNVQFLPDRDSNGKYSLDKNHPIHCVWRDVNRGHCSWRCRWWENGKRLSKNFNVKRFGDFEAMRMAITMKIRNSTPVERIQLLKEQREAVRNQMHLFASYPANFDLGAYNLSDKKITKVMNDNKKLQSENWNRLAWTYLKTGKLDGSSDSTIICRLCSKTTRCSRSRNLQQAHIMHLIRMHKNPWKQYINPNGLTKMCKLALDALYEQHQFHGNQWNLRPGVQRPEPCFL